MKKQLDGMKYYGIFQFMINGENDMKNLYFISGTMGVGKTTVSQKLKTTLPNSVFLDGDWCWDASPFQVTEETKKMVIDNICYTLNNFIKCSAYDNIIFCWVMHEQSIIDSILSRIDLTESNLINISLVANEDSLKKRIMKDAENSVRTVDILGKSLKRISLYEKLNTIKIDTTDKDVDKIVNEIVR